MNNKTQTQTIKVLEDLVSRLEALADTAMDFKDFNQIDKESFAEGVKTSVAVVRNILKFENEKASLGL